MSNINYIANLPDLKDLNLNFNKVIDESINGCVYKVAYATLINKPDICSHCGEKHINIHGYKSSAIKIMPVSGYYTILKLKKQRYICKDCGKTFMAKTNIVDKNCSILIL